MKTHLGQLTQASRYSIGAVSRGWERLQLPIGKLGSQPAQGLLQNRGREEVHGQQVVRHVRPAGCQRGVRPNVALAELHEAPAAAQDSRRGGDHPRGGK